MYIKREIKSLTLPISVLLIHQDKFNKSDDYKLFKKNLLDFFQKNFIFSLDDDLFLYQYNQSGLEKKYLKYKKKYLQLKNKNFNL